GCTGCVHRREAPAVLRAGPVRAQRGEVGGRAVALVLVESVGGIATVELVHGAIAGDLCEDGCGHDAAIARITAHPGFGRAGQAGRNRVAVDARHAGHVRDRFHRQPHAEHGGVVDVDAVDVLDADRDHVPGQGAVDDAFVELV